MLHIGCILLTLKLGGYAVDLVESIELLSTKIGMVLVVLAISHFAHIALYARIHGKPRYVNAPSSFERATAAEIL